MNRVRNAVVILGYTILAAAFAVTSYVPPPPPIKVVAPTEAQAKERFKNERKAKQRAEEIQRETVAARNLYHRLGCGGRGDSVSEVTGRAAYEYRVSVRLLTAVIFVESSCNPSAISGKNSIGLMQVNPKIWGHRNQLTDPEFNVQLGTKILASYIRHFGLVEGLHRYNGLGNPTNDYARRVLSVGGIPWPDTENGEKKNV